MKNIEIYTEYIKLDQLLKFAGLTATGAEAKAFIKQGNVKLDGEICTMRGRKIREGNAVEAMGETLTVKYIPKEKDTV